MENKLSGYEAIEYAEANGLTLSKYNDPTEDAREGLTPDEARKVASEDPSLIYTHAPISYRIQATIENKGDVTGYNVHDYFSCDLDRTYESREAAELAAEKYYLGADSDGVGCVIEIVEA